MGGVLTRWLVFAAALVIRSLIAFLFFGSVDVTNSITDAGYLLAGHPPSALGAPHLPGFQLFLWTAGMLAFHTALPVTFLFKFAGCLFDAAIAALLVDGRGPRTGWLYALAPVPVLIFAIHGQWDSLCFAFLIASLLTLRRAGQGAAALAGALFVLAAIAKPIAVPFAPFLLERRRAVAVIGGMAACFLLWIAVLWLIGDPFSFATVGRVLRYARHGVTSFGAPFALDIQQNRLLMLLPLIVLLPLYWRGRIRREDAVVLFYAFVLATCGLSAQYLVWLVPFLLLRGHHRFAALYTLAAGVFLVTFYVSPFGGFRGYNFENLGAFAPLDAVAWLTPKIANAPLRLDIIRTLGDYVIPLLCLSFLLLQFRRPAEDDAPPAPSLAPIAVAVAIAAAMFAVAWQFPRPAPEAFTARMEKKIDAYNVQPFQSPIEPERRLRGIPLDVREHPFAATNLAYVWVVVWSVVAAWPSYRSGVVPPSPARSSALRSHAPRSAAAS